MGGSARRLKLRRRSRRRRWRQRPLLKGSKETSCDVLAAGLTQEERAQREVYANSGLCVPQISPQGKGYRISFVCLCGEALSLVYFFEYCRSRSQAFAENVFGIMLLAIMACVTGVFLIVHMRFCGSRVLEISDAGPNYVVESCS